MPSLPMGRRQQHPPPPPPNCCDHHLLSSLRRCRNLICPPVQSLCQQLDMHHHHHCPHRLRRTRPPPPPSGESPPHCYIFAISSALAVLCSQPVTIITAIPVNFKWAVLVPCRCCRWGVPPSQSDRFRVLLPSQVGKLLWSSSPHMSTPSPSRMRRVPLPPVTKSSGDGPMAPVLPSQLL